MVICLTVDVEEWYHDLWPGVDEIIMEYYHHKLPKGTFVEPLRLILQMLERQRVRSTFFILGESAEACPEMVEEIYDKGHEIASHGYMHKDLTRVSLNELEKMEKKNRSFLAKITLETPKGFRAPLFKINTEVLNALEKIGYAYDSSVVPCVKVPGWFGYPKAPVYPYRPSRENIFSSCQERDLYEVPVAVFPHFRLPAGGGWFLRNFGVAYVKAAIKLLLRKKYPAILYIHPLDVYSRVPKFRGVPFHVTRNCGDYTLKALENILTNISARKVPIREII